MIHKDKEHVTNEHLALELRALRSEVRYWIIAAVAGSQILAHVSIPPVAGYAGGIAIVGFAVIKLLAFGRI